eukprot:GHVH01013674.1.p2 GENE.GHVH01013674.1~~GHVH01013674.1.p2  ORF type:complete len:411 (+),score=44.75 GHVH01013674.1:46-1278(+)
MTHKANKDHFQNRCNSGIEQWWSTGHRTKRSSQLSEVESCRASASGELLESQTPHRSHSVLLPRRFLFCDLMGLLFTYYNPHWGVKYLRFLNRETDALCIEQLACICICPNIDIVSACFCDWCMTMSHATEGGRSRRNDFFRLRKFSQCRKIKLCVNSTTLMPHEEGFLPSLPRKITGFEIINLQISSIVGVQPKIEAFLEYASRTWKDSITQLTLYRVKWTSLPLELSSLTSLRVLKIYGQVMNLKLPNNLIDLELSLPGNLVGIDHINLKEDLMKCIESRDGFFQSSDEAADPLLVVFPQNGDGDPAYLQKLRLFGNMDWPLEMYTQLMHRSLVNLEIYDFDSADYLLDLTRMGQLRRLSLNYVTLRGVILRSDSYFDSLEITSSIITNFVNLSQVTIEHLKLAHSPR